MKSKILIPAILVLAGCARQSKNHDTIYKPLIGG